MPCNGQQMFVQDGSEGSCEPELARPWACRWGSVYRHIKWRCTPLRGWAGGDGAWDWGGGKSWATVTANASACKLCNALCLARHLFATYSHVSFALITR